MSIRRDKKWIPTILGNSSHFCQSFSLKVTIDGCKIGQIYFSDWGFHCSITYPFTAISNTSTQNKCNFKVCLAVIISPSRSKYPIIRFLLSVSPSRLHILYSNLWSTWFHTRKFGFFSFYSEWRAFPCPVRMLT